MGLRYDLSRLGPNEFERMIQSLVQGIEPSTIICGDGRDDGREFFVHDANFEVLDGKYAHGYAVGQAKYKTSTNDDDITWVKSQLRGELQKFTMKKVTNPEKVPETYLFFTNVVLTPYGVKGGRDKVEKFISYYRDLIPNILVFGADDIYAMLDNNRDVARCYTSYILPGDVLKDLEEYLTALKNKKLEALLEYARQMFREDSAVHLEQAGSIADKSINIRNVYTDLEFNKGGAKETEKERIAQHIIQLGDKSHRREYILNSKYKQGNLYTDWEPVLTNHISGSEANIILLGNAGQGKSTICQYICQIYRACLLRRLRPAETQIENYLNTNEGKALTTPKCERFPIMVSLKRYAAWINEQGEDGNHSVIGYLANLIRKKTGETLSVFDFRNLLSGYSWIFFFDGLDEVPASSNRGEVLNQINLFLEKDLTVVKCDCVVVCTSRYQGYNSAFSKNTFIHYEIEQLSKSLCGEYIELLLSYLEDNSDLRDQYRRILWESLEDPTVSKLMTTPLYTAIIVLLVKVGGTPPKKRYDLFQKYCEVVITREQQKQLLPQVNEGYEWIGALHGHMGFLLQLESESADNAAAEMPKTKCLEIIDEYLIREEECNTNIHDIYNAMVTRLPFLAEVIGEDGKEKVVFPLRSIQEYFAAEWIIDFRYDETRRKVLEMISVSAYWRNVYLFVNGSYATRDKYRVMNDVMFRICLQNNEDENNEDATEAEDSEVQKIVLQGSRLALDILQDEPFKRKRDWHGYIDIAAKLLECEYSPFDVADRFLALPRRYEDCLLKEIVIPIFERNKKTGIVFRILWGMVHRGNRDAITYIENTIDSVMLSGYSELQYLLKTGYRGLSKRVLNKLLLWITGDCFVGFARTSLFLGDEEVYWNFLIYCQHELKGFDIGSLYLRQACYRMLNLRADEYTSHNRIIEYILGLNLELLEGNLHILQKEEVLERHSKAIDSDIGLYYPLEGWDDPLSQYRDYFIENSFHEVIAMIDFLLSPTYSNFKKLIIAINSLSEAYQRGFFLINEWKEYRILNIVRVYFTENRGETSINEEVIKHLYQNCIEFDGEIREYLKKGEYKSLIKKGYTEYYFTKVSILPDKEFLEILNLTDGQLVSA